jgi:hypothetical protein
MEPPQEEPYDDRSLRERGLYMGRAWAARIAADHLRPTADGEVTNEVRDQIIREMGAAWGVDLRDAPYPGEFWVGFEAGVCGMVVEMEQRAKVVSDEPS